MNSGFVYYFKSLFYGIIFFCLAILFISLQALLEDFSSLVSIGVYLFILLVICVLIYSIKIRTRWHRIYSKLSAEVLEKSSPFAWHQIPPEYASHRLILHWIDTHMEHGVNGMYDNRKVFIGTILGRYVNPAPNGEQSRGTPVKGLFIGFELKRYVSGSLIIQSDRLMGVAPKNCVEVQFESEEFNKLLDVFAPSEKIAYQLIDPALMNMLLNEEVPLTYEFHGSYLLVRVWKKPVIHPTQLFEHILKVTRQLERNIGLSSEHDLPRVHLVRNLDGKNEQAQRTN